MNAFVTNVCDIAGLIQLPEHIFCTLCNTLCNKHAWFSLTPLVVGFLL